MNEVSSDLVNTSDFATYLKIGHIAVCRIKDIKNIKLASWEQKQIDTIPNGYQPVSDFLYLILTQNTFFNKSVYITFSSEGKIVLSNQSGEVINISLIMSNSYCWAVK